MSTSSSSRATLADLLAAVATASIAERRRQDMASAVRTVARVVGKSLAEIPADLRTLNAYLNRASPTAMGISAARWNNVRSLLRSALALIGPVMKGRNLVPTSEAWVSLYDRIEVRGDRIRLSRLIRWLSGAQIRPDAVSIEDLDRFRRELAEQTLLLRHPDQAWVKILLAWNRSVDRVPGWPQLRLYRKVRPIGYTLPWSEFPAFLKQDVDGWLARLSGRDFAADGPSRPLSEETLKSQEYQLRAFASALVLRGRDPLGLTSIADCVTLENFIEGIRFFYDRFGPDNTSTAHRFACTLKSVARHWVKADDATLKEMSVIIRRLDPGRSGLTQKNRERLLPFNDLEACKKLLMLPLVLRREVEHGRLPRHRRRTLAQVAIAIEILLFVPLRRKNLAALEIDRHLVTVGKKLLLTIPAAEVKNKANDLEFELPESTVELLHWYIHEVREAEAGNQFLFPGRNGTHKSKSMFGTQITQTVQKYTGLKVNPHLFRHIAAKLYLDQNPGNYEVMRRILGHKSMNTTSEFYAGLETRSAARHFDEEILKLLRLRNLSGLTLDKDLLRTGNEWTIIIPPSASKTHVTLEYTWPEPLLDALETYLAVHRPVLIAQRGRWYVAAGNRLWVSSDGSPCTSASIAHRITKLTRANLGRPISPHLFRDAAATTIAVHDPAHVRAAAPLLGHRDSATTERYYVQAQSLEAHRQYASEIAALRQKLLSNAENNS